MNIGDTAYYVRGESGANAPVYTVMPYTGNDQGLIAGGYRRLNSKDEYLQALQSDLARYQNLRSTVSQDNIISLKRPDGTNYGESKYSGPDINSTLTAIQNEIANVTKGQGLYAQGANAGGQYVNGVYTSQESLNQQKANQDAVARGEMKVAQVVNGVPIYVSTNPSVQSSPSGPAPGQPGYKAPTGNEPGTAGVAGSGKQPAGTNPVSQAPQGQINAGTTAPGMVAQYNQKTGQYQMVSAPVSAVTDQGYTGADGKHYSLNPNTGNYEATPAQPNTASYGPVTSSPASQTGPGTANSALQNVIDMTIATSKALGIPTIKEQIDKVIQDQKDLAQAKQNDINNINNNPWLSQDIRNRELNKIEANYKSKEETYANLAKLYDSMYQQAQGQVKTIVAQAEDDISHAMDLAQKQQDAVASLQKNNQVVDMADGVYLVDKTTGDRTYLGPSKSSSGSNSSLINDEVTSIVSNFQQKMIQNGWRGVNPDDYAVWSKYLQDNYGTSAVAKLNTAMNSVRNPITNGTGIKIDIPSNFKETGRASSM